MRWSTSLGNFEDEGQKVVDSYRYAWSGNREFSPNGSLLENPPVHVCDLNIEVRQVAAETANQSMRRLCKTQSPVYTVAR